MLLSKSCYCVYEGSYLLYQIDDSMKNRTLVLLFIVILTRSANSQEVKLGFQTGIGTYSMDGLKNIVDEVPNNLSFDSKVVSYFPAYIYYRSSVGIKFNDFGVGLVYTFQSTGSRVSAKDYSGYYHFDMKVHSNNPGIYGEIKIADGNIYKIYMYSLIGLSFSKLETLEYLKVNNDLLTNVKHNFKAQNYYLEPGLNFIHHFKSLSIGLNLGYMIHFGKEAFHTGTDKKSTLFDPVNQVSVKPNWNGIRIGLSIDCIFRGIGKNDISQDTPPSSGQAPGN
jgi:hypothetical protein